MATTGPLYTRSFNPVWSFVDLQGNQCDDTFYLWVLYNTIPYLPAPVYHTPLGTPWTYPIRLLANGTLPLDVYWDPSITYRLELRKNNGIDPPSQNDQLIYPIENYSPSHDGSSTVDTEGVFTDNQITNPQFSDINFPSTLVLTGLNNPDPIEIAPGWFLELTGSGNVTVTQVALDDSNANPTNAPYALQLELAGAWTGRPVLRQRFQQNGMLWANKYVSTSLTALIQGASQQITARLDDSSGNVLGILLNATLTNSFTEYTGYFQLAASMNANLPPNAYIDYKLLLPTNCNVYLTSFQLIAQNAATNVTYQQDSIDRQIDHLFHYYKDPLINKPIPSYLTAWDFKLNPAQFFGDTVPAQAIGANKSFYAWDQTIVFQSADSGVTVSRATSGGIKLTANGGARQLAIIQYLGQQQARELLSGRCSMALRGECSSVSQTITVSLWATADGTLPDIKAANYNSIVATLDADGYPATRNGTWQPLQRSIPANAKNLLLLIPTEFSFTGWTDNAVTPLASTATYFALVIGTSSIPAGESVTFDWVSLNAGDIATQPAPQTFGDVYEQCQETFRSTFEVGTAPAQNIGANTGYFKWNAFGAGTKASYTWEFSRPMRAVPLIVTYNPFAANAQIRNILGTADYSNTGSVNTTRKSTTIEGDPNGGASSGQPAGVHASADARFGVVL